MGSIPSVRQLVPILTLGCVSSMASPAPTALELLGTASEREALVERGDYLTNAVADCQACHTQRKDGDRSVQLGPAWAGGQIFDEGWRMPETIVTPSLIDLDDWTDEQLVRALRQGLGRHGETLVSPTPHGFGSMSDRDVASIVAYLRTLPGSTSSRPEPLPRAEDPVSRGAYLVQLANCIACHSPTHNGVPVDGRFLAGGVQMQTPWGTFPTSNITPHDTTGIGTWTDEQIKRVITTGKRRNGMQVLGNLMPWFLYRNMTDADLNDIVAYLRSLQPIHNNVFAPENLFPLGG